MIFTNLIIITIIIGFGFATCMFATPRSAEMLFAPSTVAVATDEKPGSYRPIFNVFESHMT